MYRPLLKVTDNKLNISVSMINDIKKDIEKTGYDKLTWQRQFHQSTRQAVYMGLW